MAYVYSELDAVGWAISWMEVEIERCNREVDTAHFYFGEEIRKIKAGAALLMACEKLEALHKREKQLEGK